MSINLQSVTYVMSVFGITVAFEIIGADLLLLLFTMYWALSFVDMLTRIYIERVTYKNPISSYKFSAGIIKRSVKSIIMLWLIILAAYVQSRLTGSDYASLFSAVGYIPVIATFLFVLEEMISITENCIEIGDGRHNAVLKVMRYILGAGMDAGLGMAKKRAERFLENDKNAEAAVDILEKSGHKVTRPTEKK